MLSDGITLFLLSAAGAALLVVGGWILFLDRRGPEEKERMRRRHLTANGRLADAFVTDVSDQAIHYQYQVAGVVYDSAQDVGPLREWIPEDSSLILGPAYVKYLARDPQNSVLITEEWCGLRTAWPSQRPVKSTKKELEG